MVIKTSTFFISASICDCSIFTIDHVTFSFSSGIRGIKKENELEIESILARIRLGDRKAFAEVVMRFQKPLFGFLGRMGLSQAVCEEIAQETFVRAWISLGRYDPAISMFSTWIYTIARNLALNELGKAARRPEISGESLPEHPCEAHPAESMNRLQQALLKLDPSDRSILALAYVEGMAQSEIAQMEGCSKGAVKVRIHRAKQKLKAFLEKDDE